MTARNNYATRECLKGIKCYKFSPESFTAQSRIYCKNIKFKYTKLKLYLLFYVDAGILSAHC